VNLFSWAGHILSQALGQRNALVEEAQVRFGCLDDFVPTHVSDAAIDIEQHDDMRLKRRVLIEYGVELVESSVEFEERVKFEAGR
jgi:hypothetical protein